MAERRMMAKSVIETDAFMDMPMSTQCLYFHLLLRGDDDGFIASPKRVMRDVGCNDDDMKILIAKQYIIPFESGVVVIRHWKIHNYIRQDRYSPTKCDERESLYLDKDKKYTLNPSGRPLVNQLVDHSEDIRSTQSSIGKDSIDKCNSGSTRTCDDDNDDDFLKIKDFYSSNIRELEPYTEEKLRELIRDYSSQWVMAGMKRCVEGGEMKKNLRYLQAVLSGWKNDGGSEPWEQQKVGGASDVKEHDYV